MKRELSIFSLTATALLYLFISCGSGGNETVKTERDLINRIDSIEQFLFEKTNGLHEASMRRLKDTYLEYADKFPKDELSADYCFRAANMAKGLKSYPEAIAIYQRILDNYPDFKNYVDSHFMMAVVYDSDLKDKRNAKRIYMEVANKYPDHKFGKEAQALLDNNIIDMSDEDLAKFLEEKNKKVDEN